MRQTTVKIQLLILLLSFLLTGCTSSNAKYEKDLSSVFGISLDSSIEDIIEFEESTYEHSEYSLDTDGYNRIMLGFAPYTLDGKTYHKHIYRFDPDTKKMQTVEYATIQDMYCHDDANICSHVDTLKDAVLDISSSWDEKDSDGLKLTMYGNIDGTKCKISYYEGIELITLLVED